MDIAHSMILVTSPPACGKTTLAKQLARALNNAVYLDKDTLIPLSKKVFEVANEAYNRSSAFFEQHLRDLEYDVVLALGLEALEYNQNVIINAPFTREIRDPQAMEELQSRVQKAGGELKVVWVQCSPDTAHRRMVERNSDRDTWKLEHWDEYVASINFGIPKVDNLLIFDNDKDDQFEINLENLLKSLSSAERQTV